MDIKTYRKAKKLSQEELAKRIGVSRNAIARYENGEMTPKTDKLILLSKELDHDFLSEIVDENNYYKTFNPLIDLFMETPDILINMCVDEMGYKVVNIEPVGEGYWIIADEEGKQEYKVSEYDLESLFSRFIKHMKIDFETFLKEHDSNVREAEEEKK